MACAGFWDVMELQLTLESIQVRQNFSRLKLAKNRCSSSHSTRAGCGVSASGVSPASK